MLLVDDDESLRRALTRTIRLAGYDVKAFSSAEILIASGVSDCDVCLVLDVVLPGMDGVACKRMLDAAGRRVPTVFITALTPAEVSEPLSGVSSIAVLHKPFNKNDLLDAIGRAFR